MGTKYYVGRPKVYECLKSSDEVTCCEATILGMKRLGKGFR